jgi:hypothetical protein
VHDAGEQQGSSRAARRVQGEAATRVPHATIIGPARGIWIAGGYRVSMRTFSAASAAPPDVVRRLMSEPGEWERWALHLRLVWGPGLGAVGLAQRVEPRPGGGSTVAVDLSAPWPLERAIAVAYGPLIEVALRRLAQAAERVVGAPA